MFVLTIEKMSLKPSKQIKYQNNTIFSLNIWIFNFLLLFTYNCQQKRKKKRDFSSFTYFRYIWCYHLPEIN